MRYRWSRPIPNQAINVNETYVSVRSGLISNLACWLLCSYVFIFWLVMPAMANALSQENILPSFAELQAAGAVIGEIRINVQDIFNLDDPKENNFLFRLANTLHINTRPDVIRRTLLFKSGEPVSVRLIEETERLLHDNRYLAFACMAEKYKCVY